jgi:hypothetical protein
MNHAPDLDRDSQREAEKALAYGRTADKDASAELYRRIFEVLQEPMAIPLDPGFRHHVAAMAMKAHQGNKGEQEPWHVVMLILGLFGAFVLALVQKLPQIGWSHAFDLPTQAIVAVAVVTLGDLMIRKRCRERSCRFIKSHEPVSSSLSIVIK